MTDSDVKITIGITAYNEGDYLCEAWSSVIQQTDNRWNAVMILDGGADKETQRIYNNIEHPFLKKIKLDNNKGPYFARNLAIENAKDDWYCHLDADDRLPPNMVYNIQSTIDKYPNSKYIIGRCLYFDENSFHVRDHSGFLDDRLAFNLPFNGQSPIKRELYYELGGFCKEFYNGGADWDFWLGVCELNSIGINIDSVIYERRFRKNNVGSNWIHKRYQFAELLINRHIEYFQGDKKNICLSKSYEFAAREYRRIGVRNEAAILAKQALKLGNDNQILKTIIYEYEMPFWRYRLRRLGRIASKFNRIF